MNRRDSVLSLLALGVAAAPLAAEAQQAAKVPRIGYLSGNLAGSSHMTEGFRQGLRDLGYVDGRNVVIEFRDAEGKLERLPALAAELVARKVDVIVVGGTVAALVAKEATRTLPILLSIRLRTGSSLALRGQGAMSRGCPPSPRS
jgi:putative ABC transport system substrate-binding protein